MMVMAVIIVRTSVSNPTSDKVFVSPMVQVEVTGK